MNETELASENDFFFTLIMISKKEKKRLKRMERRKGEQ